ncbi:hypothetical protein SERLADRAFT_391209, partial [Serpula lacrymans var. lacrymans S7.9]
RLCTRIKSCAKFQQTTKPRTRGRGQLQQSHSKSTKFLGQPLTSHVDGLEFMSATHE